MADILDIGIVIKETTTQLREAILKSIRDEFNIAIPKAIPLIKQNIESRLKPVFTRTPEYESLTQGPLNAHFGFIYIIRL